METKFNLDEIFIVTICCVKNSLEFLIFSQLVNINYVTSTSTNGDSLRLLFVKLQLWDTS